MKCAICREGQTAEDHITATFDRNGVIIVVKDVPAQVCQNCGEEYIDDNISAQLLKQAEDAEKSGTLVEIRTFAA